MMQMVDSASALRECGSGILAGWRRAESLIWRLVVRVSQMGVSAWGSSGSASRFFLAASSWELAAFLIWASRALEALRI